MKPVTFCLTSCNRFNLLEKTLDSFLSLNNYPIEKFIITEDSGSLEMKQKIINKYGDRFEVILNEKNLGLFPSIDNMYKQVNTEYVFHCEDDWKFFSNPYFIQESIDILEERKDINQVWLRPIKTLHDWVEGDTLSTSTNVPYHLMKNPHLDVWCGFSLNPGLRRLSDYKRIFPNGMSEFIRPNEPIVFTEYDCNIHAGKNGYRAAVLVNEACDHIGQGQSTYV